MQNQSTVKIKEIFTSIQGEGTYVGEKQTFVRFCKCNLACKYCDTDFSAGVEYSSFDLGQKLKQIRKAQKLTQAQLAELAGINEKHVSKIETGVYFPTYNTLSRILGVLKLDIADFSLNFDRKDILNEEYYLKSLQILHSAKTSKEIEYFYGFLLQAQKSLDILQND